MRTKRLLLGTGLLFGCAALGAAAIESGPDPEPAQTTAGPTAAGTSVSFQSDGSLRKPKGYRSWVFVGAPLTPNDLNNGAAAFPEFHTVYIDPESYESYKRSGKFRDGTVILKELSTVGAKSSTSGKGYFQGEFTGLEAIVKSSERFPNEPGNWGFFRFTDEEGGAVHETAEVLPTASCAACHQASAEDDLIFTQHYPVLRAAKSFGRGNPED